MFQTIDTLNNAFTYIATAYIYLGAIVIALLFVQYVLDRRDHATAVSDEFYQQTKVLLSVEPKEPVAPQGKVLKLTVEGRPNTLTLKQRPNEPAAVIDPWLDIDFGKMGIRAIRQYVRDNFLQELIKNSTGKSVARCTLNELRKALTESQECDRIYSRIINGNN